MTTPADGAPLNILHVFRAPLGGLFRHVADLVQGQIDRGHRVGIIADSTRHGPHPEGILDRLQGQLALGLTRIPIARHIGPGDFAAAAHVARRMTETNAQVVHGHGAKGGAFARLAARAHPAIRAYTPHGGSLLYRPGSLASYFYIGLERLLMPRTDLFLFESAYVADLYRTKVGNPKGLVRIVRNGVGEKEFAPIAPRADATDILFIGELRPVKGVDVLLDAIAEIRASGIPVTATIVGGGGAQDDLIAQSRRLKIDNAVRFHAPMPAREAFALGKIAVIPSRAESMPYIVLEIAAAGMPLITTRVGGIPDIYGPQSARLIAPDDRPALVREIRAAINEPETIRNAAAGLRERVRNEFSLDAMVDGVISGYRAAIAAHA